MSAHHTSPFGDRHASSLLRHRTSARAPRPSALVTRLVVGAALATTLAACGATTPTGPRAAHAKVRGDQTTTTDTTARSSGYQNPMV